MPPKARILEALELVTAVIPVPIYWLNKNNELLGANPAMLKAVGSPFSYEDSLGKTAYDVYPREMAEKIIQHNQEVINSGTSMSQEEAIKDITTGRTKYFIAVKAPLRNDNGEVIGLVGTSIEITAEKEAARLELELQAHQAEQESEEHFKKFVEDMSHLMDAYQMTRLNKKTGKKFQNNIHLRQIKLNRRERQILYYLSLNLSAKEIAEILTIIEKKSVSATTIHSTINNQLYLKLDVYGTGDLIQRAKLLNLIPFILD